jgi:hypothetical protein
MKMSARRFTGEGAKTNIMNAAILFAGKKHNAVSGGIKISNGKMYRHGDLIVKVKKDQLFFSVPTTNKDRIDRIAIRKINAVLQQHWDNRLIVRHGDLFMDSGSDDRWPIELNETYRMIE